MPNRPWLIVCLSVLALTCVSPKEALNITYMLYRPDPYGPIPYGTNLSLSCDRGYPQHGAKVITCSKVKDNGTDIARWTWEGDSIDMKPDCLGTNCIFH
jgi:hypothetical protein